MIEASLDLVFANGQELYTSKTRAPPTPRFAAMYPNEPAYFEVADSASKKF